METKEQKIKELEKQIRQKKDILCIYGTVINPSGIIAEIKEMEKELSELKSQKK